MKGPMSVAAALLAIVLALAGCQQAAMSKPEPEPPPTTAELLVGTWTHVETVGDEVVISTLTLTTEGRWIRSRAHVQGGTRDKIGWSNGIWTATDEVVTVTGNTPDGKVTIEHEYVLDGDALAVQQWFNHFDAEPPYQRWDRRPHLLDNPVGLWKFRHMDDGEYRGNHTLQINADGTLRYEQEPVNAPDSRPWGFDARWEHGEPGALVLVLTEIVGSFTNTEGETEPDPQPTDAVWRFAYAPTDLSNEMIVSHAWNEAGYPDPARYRPEGHYWMLYQLGAEGS